LSSPAIVNDVVFVSTNKSALYALHVDDGHCLWSAPGLPAGEFALGPAVYGNYVVLGAGNAVYIYKLGRRFPRPPILVRPWWWDLIHPPLPDPPEPPCFDPAVPPCVPELPPLPVGAFASSRPPQAIDARASAARATPARWVMALNGVVDRNGLGMVSCRWASILTRSERTGTI